jgi:histone-lysine N-methyltransferase SETMAR
LTQLQEAWGPNAPSQKTVKRWYERFERDDFDLYDAPRSGRPISMVTKENIDAVAKLIKDDPRITYEEIAEDLQISAPSIHTIIYDHLHLRKVTARWVPHLLKPAEMEARVRISKEMLSLFENGESSKIKLILTGDETWLYNFEPLRKSQSRQWVGENDPRPAKVVKSRYSSKQMVAVFFTIKGLVEIVALPPSQTITAQWYSDICLDTVFDSLQKSRRLKVTPRTTPHPTAPVTPRNTWQRKNATS